MQIVVLDGYTLNPGDLSWAPLQALGSVTFYDRTPPELVTDRCRDADIILTNKAIVNAASIAALPKLRYIGVTATGYNIVDVAAAKAHNIIVSNAPGYGTTAVVQMTFALLLEFCQHVQHHSDAVRSGRWSASKDFCFWDFPLIELSGKTMGLFGYGTIGKQVAAVASAFGMNTIACSRSSKAGEQDGNTRFVSFDDLLQQSDVISIHSPLTNETNGIFNKDAFSRMKPTAFFINTSRGPIVVNEDLADALNQGIIAGAGIDVLPVEPPPAGDPLFTAKNCFITPHIAWATREARLRLLNMVVENLQAFQRGKPTNVVNG